MKKGAVLEGTKIPLAPIRVDGTISLAMMMKLHFLSYFVLKPTNVRRFLCLLLELGLQRPFCQWHNGVKNKAGHKT